MYKYVVVFFCATKLVSSTNYKKECGKMSTEELNRTEKIDYAKKVLKQYKSNSYLADLGIKPNLTADGTISNLSEFLEIKDKTKNPLSCDTPLEKIASIAPRAVASILEGIHKMNTSYEEKKHLFDLYIERTEEANEASEDMLVAFADAYDDSYMGTPTSQPATEI